MKLNSKGWGVFQMMWMSAIILFFFLLVIILIQRYYREMGYNLIDKSVIENRNHEEMLQDLNNAAKKYVEYYYANVNDMTEIKLSADRLFQVGLFAKDLYGDCNGYAIAKKNSGVIKTQSYIKCGNYKSPGYNKK